MKIQGDLNPSSLAELFKNLSDQRATGILSVFSPMGEKHIALSRGEVAIYSDRLSERTRIGDLLVARGKLTEEKLEEALRLQHQSPKRVQLGHLLVEKSFITKDDINDAVKFQLEEEICDLFTYKGATFEFDSNRRPEELEGEFSAAEGSQAFVHRLSIDPQALILEASRRIDDWKLFEERLPSPYLCFRISAKGEEMKAKSGAATQRLIKLLREGRTLETVVKLSCQGRFNIYKSMIRFLDDGWIVPCPAADLRFMASEHRSQERYADALYIYRRLLELTTDELEKRELEQSLEEVVESILRAQAAGRRPEGIEVVSHKGAAAAYQRRQRIARLVLGGVAAISILLSFWWWLNAQRRDPPPEAYRTAMEQVDAALAAERYGDAIITWYQFYVKHCDPESDLGKLVHARLDGLYAKYNRQVEFLRAQGQFLAQAGRLDEAEAVYNRLLKECPENRYEDEIQTALKEIAARRGKAEDQKTLAGWGQQLDAALDLEKRKLYDQAREALLKTSEGAPAGSEVRRKSEEALARIQEVSGRIRDQFQIGLDHLRDRKANKALAAFDASMADWPDNEWALKARQQAMLIRAKQQRIREDLAAARAAEGRGEAAEALQTFERLAREYSDFEEVQDLNEKIEQLGARLHNAEDLTQRAQAADKAGKTAEARDLFAQLLRSHRRYLAQKKVAVPVQISSTPTGAEVSIAGKPVGHTPLRTTLPADEEIKLTLTLPGFAEQVRSLRRVEPDGLELAFRLERAALAAVTLPDAAPAGPLLHEGRLYVAAGAVVVAMEPDGSKIHWTSKRLVDAETAKVLEAERLQVGTLEAWWLLQSTPLPLAGGKILVATPLRELLVVQASNGSATPLARLNGEPQGQGLAEGSRLAGGRTLLALTFTDGSLRAFDAAAPKNTLWEHPLDEGKTARPAPVHGVMQAGTGQLATASRAGLLSVWETSTGKKRWSIALETELADAAGAPENAGAYCALLTSRGAVIAAETGRGQKLWELAAAQPQERAAAAAIGVRGFYVLTRDGNVRRYPKAPATGQPKADWEKPLDDMGPALAEFEALLFVATNTGHVYALSADTGRELWRYKCSGRPLTLKVLDKRLYVTTSDAKLVILNAE